MRLRAHHQPQRRRTGRPPVPPSAEAAARLLPGAASATPSRACERENIRQFLTGNAITLVLDLVFSVVFIAVVLPYSGWLTLVVVVSLPLYLGLSLTITPLLRARLLEKFNCRAENQAFLVETINDIDTLKVVTVEPPMTRRCENQQAAYVSAGFRTATRGTLANEPGHYDRAHRLPQGAAR